MPRGTSSHEALYRSIVDTAVDSIIVIDEGGTIVAFNPAAERTFGYGEPEVLGQNVNMLMDEPYRSGHDGYLARYVQTGERRIIGIGREAVARRKDGSIFPIEMSVAEWRSGENRFFTGILRNISERKEAEDAQRRLREELERERALLRSIVEHLPSGLMIAEAPSGRLLSQNAAADRVLGHGTADVANTDEYGRFPSEWPDGTRLASHEHPLVRAIEHGVEVEQEEIIYTRPDGRKATLLCNAGPVRDAGGIVFGVSTFIDITERRELEARVEHLARHEPLTGLANRMLFGERLADAVRDAAGEGSFAALMLLDLDRFKSVNDSFGHLVGDALLREVADRISVAIRPSDTAARIGGDEFAVVLHGATSQGAGGAVAERIASTVTQPALIDGHVIEVSASLGYAVCPTDADDPETLLHNADLALYHSKSLVHDRVFKFHRGLAEEADRKARLEVELRHAIEADELVLHYQPQIELSTRRITAVEALVRWNRHGVLVPPAEFIPLAETSGTIHRLGEWVIRSACRQKAEWQRQNRDFTVGINISPVQANTPDLISTIDRELAAFGLDGSSIELEITESMLFNPERPSVAAFLGACRSRGIGLAVDDFGVGYSSLGYLARLPISKVKIDRSFVARVDGDTEESLLSAMIDLGQKLGKRVVAEGVETPEQHRYLRSLGDLDAQGYHFAPPQPPEVLDAWITDSGRAGSRTT